MYGAWGLRGFKMAFQNLTLNQLNDQSALQNRAYIISKKPDMNGKIKVKIGNRYSRCG